MGSCIGLPLLLWDHEGRGTRVASGGLDAGRMPLRAQGELGGFLSKGKIAWDGLLQSCIRPDAIPDKGRALGSRAMMGAREALS